MQQKNDKSTVKLGECKLTVNDIISVTKHNAEFYLKNCDEAIARIEPSYRYIQEILHNLELIYGVNTNFREIPKSLIRD